MENMVCNMYRADRVATCSLKALNELF